ncbi:pilus assembly protein [Sphingobium sufflavum]|uniref:TadE/TadG family type IV pilus assembly protein n=1 Tax=Sphingobium sufflavum TaxID=1129547 RepID=UPI001F41DABF|nr:TadE/TadG family type IV pilus assembly protein [Sphingobium sufflavum]MCE7797794.1 pilus assembly protein [Sphingobium sufflavum]
MMTRTAALLRTLRADASGLAFVEFALALPLVLGTVTAGIELTYYTIAKMRMSQIALHIADNGARIGTQNPLTSPQITEANINDLLTGAGLQAGRLDLYTRGRVIISSLEPDPSYSGKYRIHWQRCKGTKNWTSSYGVQGDGNKTNMGPAGRQVTAPSDGGVIYVELNYDYKPIFFASVAPSTVIREVAAMTIRDKRDYNGNSNTGVYSVVGVTASTCNLFTAT